MIREGITRARQCETGHCGYVLRATHFQGLRCKNMVDFGAHTGRTKVAVTFGWSRTLPPAVKNPPEDPRNNPGTWRSSDVQITQDNCRRLTQLRRGGLKPFPASQTQ